MKNEIKKVIDSFTELLTKIDSEIDKIWDVIGARNERVFIRYADEENPTSAEGYIKIGTLGDGCEYQINFNMQTKGSPTNIIIDGLSVNTLKRNSSLGDICEFDIKIQNMTSGSVKVKLYTDETNTIFYESPFIVDTYRMNDKDEFVTSFIISGDKIDKLADTENVILEISSTN